MARVRSRSVSGRGRSPHIAAVAPWARARASQTGSPSVRARPSRRARWRRARSGSPSAARRRTYSATISTSTQPRSSATASRRARRSGSKSSGVCAVRMSSRACSNIARCSGERARGRATIGVVGAVMPRVCGFTAAGAARFAIFRNGYGRTSMQRRCTARGDPAGALPSGHVVSADGPGPRPRRRARRHRPARSLPAPCGRGLPRRQLPRGTAGRGRRGGLGRRPPPVGQPPHRELERGRLVGRADPGRRPHRRARGRRARGRSSAPTPRP